MLVLGACSIWPSTWRIGGTPLDRVKRSEAERTRFEGEAVAHAQAAVHKAGTALQSAPADNRPVAVARDFLAEAAALLDQARGAPTAADATGWRELVAGLLSDNAQTRAAAERERASQAASTNDLAIKLAAATASAVRERARALDYAREREALADFAGKLKLGFYAIIGLFVLGTVLSLAARFFPALGLASKVINGVVAPGITFAAYRAQAGLHAVGAGLKAIRTSMPQAAKQVTDILDVATDADHQAEIARGANA
ncbi:MAG: hypothetical protein AAB368_11180 [bacterium]